MPYMIFTGAECVDPYSTILQRQMPTNGYVGGSLSYDLLCVQSGCIFSHTGDTLKSSLNLHITVTIL